MISTDLTDRWTVTHTHTILNIFVDAEKSHIQSLEVKMVVLKIMQNYVVNWYHTYLLHPVMFHTEAAISKN